MAPDVLGPVLGGAERPPAGLSLAHAGRRARGRRAGSLASAAFALYVANFGSYNKTYGSLGGVIAFLVWLWISNIAVLLGAELNAELERGRELEAGQPAEDEILRRHRAWSPRRVDRP